MLEFSEYCKITDMLNLKGTSSQRINVSSDAKTGMSQMLFMCAAFDDSIEDNAYFEALLKRSNMETLQELKPYFEGNDRLLEIICERIDFLQKYSKHQTQNSASPQSAYANKLSNEEEFYMYLCKWMDKKGFVSDAEFYNEAYISRQTFNKLKNGKTTVSREMAIHLAISLKLNYEECSDFLQHCGYSLNPNDKRDQIISFILRNRKYTIIEVDEILSIFNERTFLDWD